MSDRDFKDLCESVKQAGKIVRGKMLPSRTFHVQPSNSPSKLKRKKNGDMETNT